MDFFGSDDEEDSKDPQITSQNQEIEQLKQIFNTLFIGLMKLKPFAVATKVPVNRFKLDCHSSILIDKKVILSKRIAFFVPNVCNILQQDFMERLKIAKFEHVSWYSHDELTNNQLFVDSNERMFDMLIYVSMDSNPPKDVIQSLYTLLISGGHLLTTKLSNTLAFPEIFDEYYWNNQEITNQNIPQCTQLQLITIKKRSVLCNEIAAIYWTANTQRLAHERELLEQISVPILVSERESGIFSDVSRERGIHIMNQHGVCIFPGVYDRKYIHRYHEESCKDMKNIVEILQEKKQIDLLHPMKNTTFIENFHELSMREALRCDVRNVKHMKDLLSELHYPNNQNQWPMYDPIKQEKDIYKTIEPQDQMHTIPPSHNIRFHPSLITILQMTMNPPNPVKEDELGNWGRWNFEGPGPEAPIPIRVGNPGVIFSFPGCSDQTIHADAAQLFVHQEMPAHYINLFIATSKALQGLTRTLTLPTTNETLRGFDIGMTAFNVGSHLLHKTATIMTQEGGQERLEESLIRPQLHIGDALFFDTRILHFGLAHQYEGPSKPSEGYDVVQDEQAWRTLLYVNYHHTWFNDPKNWNDNEKLFA